MLLTIAQLLAGLVLLTLGAGWLVKGASGLARTLGVAPLIIGLTVVAFGTSAPELAVSLRGVFADQADIALGNVVGSNIFNVLCILGASALAAPLIVHQKLVRVDVPLMIAVSGGLWLASLDGAIGRIDGAMLFTGIILYTLLAIRSARRESAQVRKEYEEKYIDEPKPAPVWLSVVLVVLGLVLLVLGARWLVSSATDIARSLGVSELVIGLTIVAAGTSLPELATSLIAAVKGERDIAVGNIVGSNLFNILCTLGLSSLVTPEPISVSDQTLALDLPVMLAAAVACLPIFLTGRIRRPEAALLLAAYVGYVAALWFMHKAGGAPDELIRWSPAIMISLLVAGLGTAIGHAIWRRRAATQP